jgi:hypothetical protein
MKRPVLELGRAKRSRRAALAAAVALCLAACSAQAVEGLRFGFESATRFGADANTIVMTMRGEVQPGDADRFAQFVAASRERFIEHGARVVFAVDGGDVLEALRIGELLRDALVEAWLPEAASSRCISSCFFMYAYSASRSAVAESVGLHRPYYDSEALAKASPAAVRASYESLAAQLRGRMEQLSVPVALVERMFGLPAGEVYWLSQQDLEALGRRQAWFEDYLAARCGRLEEHATAAPAATCIDELLRSHRKGFVDRLSQDDG